MVDPGVLRVAVLPEEVVRAAAKVAARAAARAAETAGGGTLSWISRSMCLVEH